MTHDCYSDMSFRGAMIKFASRLARCFLFKKNIAVDHDCLGSRHVIHIVVDRLLLCLLFTRPSTTLSYFRSLLSVPLLRLSIANQPTRKCLYSILYMT